MIGEFQASLPFLGCLGPFKINCKPFTKWMFRSSKIKKNGVSAIDKDLKHFKIVFEGGHGRSMLYDDSVDC